MLRSLLAKHPTGLLMNGQSGSMQHSSRSQTESTHHLNNYLDVYNTDPSDPMREESYRRRCRFPGERIRIQA